MTRRSLSQTPPRVRGAQPVYAWFARHTMLVDSLLAGLMWLILVAAETSTYSGLSWPLWLACFVLYSALVVPLAWRRVYPVASSAVIVVAYLTQLAFHLPIISANISVFWVIYALAAFGPRWTGMAAFALAFCGAGAAVAVYGVGGINDGSPAAEFILSWVVIAAFLGISWLLGDVTRSRRLVVAGLRERTQRLEIEKKQEGELAAADERARIAREMHDIVAHSLSVMIAQADGARYVARADPALAEAALATISDTGRQSLAEMRRLLGLLRSDVAASTRPVPTLTDIDALIAQLRDSGVPVESSRVGEQRRPMDAGAELAAYRVIQESFTNVLKHAGPGATVRVSRAWDARGLTIEVSDDGRGRAADDAAADPDAAEGRARANVAAGAQGQGIRGMRERVGLYGGTVEAGPLRGGGYRVTARIPYGGNS